MIARTSRFPLRQSSAVFRTGKLSRGTYMDVYTMDSPEKKAAVVVGKHVSLKAVVRNHLKRVMYEVWRTKLLHTITQNVVIRLKSRSAHARSQELEAELLKLAGHR